MQYSISELGLVDTSGNAAFDNMTQLAATIFDAPVSLVSIIDHEKNRQYFTSQIGLSPPWDEKKQTPLTHSFCQHVVADNAVLVVENAHENDRVKNNLAVPVLGVVAYLGAPVHNAYGKPLGALCVIDSKPRTWTARDISTLQSLASCVTETIKLKSSYLDKEALLSDLTEFNYSISHDLKSPVNTLQLLLYEIAETWNTVDGKRPDETIEKAIKTTQYMNVMVEDTLDYIQIIMSEDTDSTTVPLQTTLDAVIENLSDQIAEHKATITFSSLPALVADPNLLNILFHQLLSNAIKFRKPNVPPIVSVTYERTNDGAFHKIIVSDNGVGIDAEYHDYIFTLFARLHSRVEHTGTGLGLSICQRIVGLYNGYLEIESKPDQGTSVIVFLPQDSPLSQAA